MRLSPVAQRLYDEIAQFTIIDAHEHLPPEKEYLAKGYSGLNFFAGYVWHDLGSAGLPLEFKARMRDTDLTEVRQWWPVIRPYWEQARHGSYARAALLTARAVYGLPDINDQTIEALAEAVRENNRPGLYRRILGDICRVERALTCQPHTRFQDDPLLRPVTQLVPFQPANLAEAEQHAAEVGVALRDVEDAAAAARARLARDRDEGAVGFKTVAYSRGRPDVHAARQAFRGLRNTGHAANPSAIEDYVHDEMLKAAAELDMTVAVHAGVWGDFRRMDPKNFIPEIERHPSLRIDLFHLGMPMVRDAVMVGKNFPNVSLNLCWSHVVSQRMARHGLDEALDLVPINKIIAFGADYRVVVEKAVGHLIMARENVAAVLAGRVEDGEMDEATAVGIARRWFYDNPKRIYRL
jgi:predicted TIM-barrel fold metal-dependent hydrolase